MHSFLIISKDKSAIELKVKDLLKENMIDIFDENYFTFEKSAGIEDIRKIAEKLYLKPFKSEKKAIILDLSVGISTEAQNALLKTLEEPPANTIIVVTIDNKEDLLPTILSRCQIYELKDEVPLDENFSTQVSQILESGEGKKMEIAQEFGRDRETAINFVEQTILSASSLAKKNDSKKYLNLLKNLDQAYSTLKNSNVNPRLILENYLLNI